MAYDAPLTIPMRHAQRLDQYHHAAACFADRLDAVMAAYTTFTSVNLGLYRECGEQRNEKYCDCTGYRSHSAPLLVL